MDYLNNFWLVLLYLNHFKWCVVCSLLSYNFNVRNKRPPSINLVPVCWQWPLNEPWKYLLTIQENVISADDTFFPLTVLFDKTDNDVLPLEQKSY